MNFGIIRKILGKFMILLAALLVLPLSVSIIYQEGMRYYLAYAIPSVSLFLLGHLVNVKNLQSSKMLVREGMIIVGLSWIVMSLFGCIPFMITGEIPNFFDAFFEMASGFTTTGASIVPSDQVEKLSHSVQFWRSFSHWIGGMGVLVFILAIIPESKEGSTLHILRAESPGPQVNRLASKMASSSRILYLIYIFFTVVEFLFLLFGPDPEMNVFNSMIYSLGTAGTGGFGIHAEGFAAFTPYTQYIVSIFMIVFGINFSLFYLLLIRNFKDVYKNTELKVYFIVLIVSISLITFNLFYEMGAVFNDFEFTFRTALFQVASIISTTGYSSFDFNTWPALSKIVILVLMCFGACAGSTAGGFKLTRVTILFKSMLSKVKRMVRPRKVETIYMDGKPLSNDTIESVSSYLVVYVIIFVVCTFLISIYNPGMNLDIETSFTASFTCLNNVGPGLGLVGPAGSFADFSDFSKFVLTLEMIAGRLELFPILLLFSPNMWRKRS